MINNKRVLSFTFYERIIDDLSGTDATYKLYGVTIDLATGEILTQEDIAPVILGSSYKNKIKSTVKEELITKKIPQNAKIISLCVEGKAYSSEEFATDINSQISMGRNLCFIIGSSYGLCTDIKKGSELRLSLSEMTFPHQLFRVMCLEQIYRAFKINEGSTYHK
mgnify:CR=1 FL=1